MGFVVALCVMGALLFYMGQLWPFRRWFARPKHVRLVYGLLTITCPKCFVCGRAAVRYEGSPYDGRAAKSYACDGHAVSDRKWFDLPGAETVREAEKLVAEWKL
jgi:hypothetical protein